MFLLPQRRIWTQQPYGANGLDGANRLTDGLVLAYCLAIRDTNLVNGEAPTLYAYGGSYGAEIIKDGVACASDYGGGAPQFSLPVIGQGDLTMLHRTVYVYGSGNQYCLACYNSGSGLGLAIKHSSIANRWGLYYGPTRLSSGEAAPNDGLPHTYVGVRAANGDLETYRDGAMKSTSAAAVFNDSNNNWVINGMPQYGVGGGKASITLIWHRRLSASEIRSLSENPWQIFRAPYSRIFVPTGVSAPTNVILTATGISTTPTLGTPSVAQDHVLTCAAISATPTLGTPALTAVAPSGLTAQDISTTPTLGTPAIAQIHTLTATAISATPTLGAPALTVVAPSGLTAQGISTQPVTLDTPTLNQTHGLTAQNITTQAAVLGAPALFGGEHVLPTPLLLSSFSATEDYTYPTNAIVSTYTDGGPDEGKVRMVGDGTAGSTYARRWTTESILPANMGVVAWLVNVRAGSYNGTQAMLIRGSNAGTVTMPGTLASQRIGRRWVAADVSEFGPFAAGDLGTIFHQININQSSPYDSDAVVGPMRYQAKGRPTIVLTFDDVPVEQFDTVFPLMSARGLRGTAYAVKNFTGANPQRMTLANLQSLYAAGWDIGTNTTNDESVTSFASDAACVADLQAAKDWLIANGMTRAVDHMALSNGVWSESRVAALESAGMRTARTTNQSDLFTRFGFGDMAMTLPGHSATGATLATLTNKVDTAILRGSAQTFYFHDVSSTPSGIGTSTSTFTALLDYIKTKVDAGELDVLTVSEWYERDSGVVSLTAADIVTSAPLLGTPALSVIAASALVAQNISTSPPVLGTPALSQNHILSGVAIATGSPTLGTPALTQVAPGMLVAQGITTSPAVLGAPAMAQNHGLSAGAIAAGPPTFTTPTLSQQHALLAQWITAGAAALGQPVLVEGGAPAAIDPGPARYRVRANLRNYRAQVNPRNYRVTK